MTDKELRILDEMRTNLEIWSTWNKTFSNEMLGICSKMRNLLADRKTESRSVIGESFPSYITENRTTQVLDGWQVNPRTSTTTVKEEPQTDCERCAEYGSYKCTKCDGEMYYKPQTERENNETD